MSALILPRTHPLGLGRPLMGLDHTNPITKGLVEVGNPLYARNRFVANDLNVDVTGLSFGVTARSAYLPHSDAWKPTTALSVLVWLGSHNASNQNGFICGCEVGTASGWGIYTLLGSISARVRTTERSRSVTIGAWDRTNNVLGFTWDGATLRTWRGGAAVGSNTLGGTIINAATTLDINGKGNGVDTAASHNVSQICIWDRALDADEIRSITYDPYQIYGQIRTLIEV